MPSMTRPSGEMTRAPTRCRARSATASPTVASLGERGDSESLGLEQIGNEQCFPLHWHDPDASPALRGRHTR